MDDPTRTRYLSSPLEHQAALQSVLTPSTQMILEVGGCEGLDTIRYLRLFPKAHVHVFEPVPENVRRMRQNLAGADLLDRATIHEFALGRAEATMPLWLSSGQPDGRQPEDWDYGNKSSSLYRPGRTRKVHPWLKFEETIEVTVAPAAATLAAHGIAQVDLVHMDVQGAELDVLVGFGDSLASVHVLWLEVERIALYRRQPKHRRIGRFLRRNGFVLHHDTVGRISGDQLWVNHRWAGRES